MFKAIIMVSAVSIRMASGVVHVDIDEATALMERAEEIMETAKKTLDI